MQNWIFQSQLQVQIFIRKISKFLNSGKDVKNFKNTIHMRLRPSLAPASSHLLLDTSPRILVLRSNEPADPHHAFLSSSPNRDKIVGMRVSSGRSQAEAGRNGRSMMRPWEMKGTHEVRRLTELGSWRLGQVYPLLPASVYPSCT